MNRVAQATLGEHRFCGVNVRFAWRTSWGELRRAIGRRGDAPSLANVQIFQSQAERPKRQPINRHLVRAWPNFYLAAR